MGLAARLIDATPATIAARFRTDSTLAQLTRPLINRVLPEEAVITTRAGPAKGTRLRIYPRSEKYYWTGLYEVEVQRTFARTLHAGATVWDIGAHIGFLTALAAKCVRPGGRVHAFEPLNANRSRLADTIRLNELKEVRVHRLALASHSGKRTLYGHTSTSMWSLLEQAGTHRVEVPCVTLDGLLDDKSFGIPSLVKIDAEGAELDILRGGRRLAETGALLVVEFTDTRVLEETRALLSKHAFEQLSDRHWLIRKAM